jgi:hypothetical protein
MILAAEALYSMLTLLGLSAAAWLGWAVKDAIYAFDRDEDTHTASERMKQWRRKHGFKGDVALGTPILALLAIPIYLFLHLILELV